MHTIPWVRDDKSISFSIAYAKVSLDASFPRKNLDSNVITIVSSPDYKSKLSSARDLK